MTVVMQYIAALASSIGAFSAGTILGWPSPAADKLKAYGHDNGYNFRPSEEDLSWIGGVVGLGAAVMCPVAGILIDVIGRKITMLLLLLPFTIGWFLIIFATNATSMIIGRIFLGVACGGICIAAPMYTGEISQKNIRGILGSFFQLMITLGILFVYIFGIPGVNVQTFSIVCAVIPYIFGICILFCPESPTYWVKKGKNEKAIKSLKWLRGKDYDCEDEIAELVKEEQSKKDQNFAEGLKRKSTIKGLIISNGLMLFQQMCGINAVIFFQTIIFKDAGSTLEPWICTIVVGAVQVIATSGSTVTLDRLGRRLLLLISGSVMAVCTILLGVFFILKDKKMQAGLEWLPVTALCIFIVAFSAGYGPVPWVVLGEIFAPDVKGVAGSVAGCLNWILAFVVSKTFINLKEAAGAGPTFFIYTAFSLIGIVFVVFAVPETKGKSLQEIQEMLEK